MLIQELRNAAPNEEIDYVFLKSALRKYSRPRDKISSLLQSELLIRVKKGLYVFGPKIARRPYSKEALANLIYGPSYISMEFALAYFHLIPERVEIVTSVTCKRDKSFNTPVGRFTYRYLHPDKYPVGVIQIFLDPTHPILIATQEKALADQLAISPSKPNLDSIKEMRDYLFEGLRMEEKDFAQLNQERLVRIAQIYRNRNVNLLTEHFKNWKRVL